METYRPWHILVTEEQHMTWTESTVAEIKWSVSRQSCEMKWKKMNVKIVIISSLSLYIQQVFDILSLYVHPSLSSAVRLSAIKPSSFVKSCSIWILLLAPVGLSLILPSVITHKRLIMFQNIANLSMFLLRNRDQYLVCLHLLFWDDSSLHCALSLAAQCIVNL